MREVLFLEMKSMEAENLCVFFFFLKTESGWVDLCAAGLAVNLAALVTERNPAYVAMQNFKR